MNIFLNKSLCKSCNIIKGNDNNIIKMPGPHGHGGGGLEDLPDIEVEGLEAHPTVDHMVVEDLEDHHMEEWEVHTMVDQDSEDLGMDLDQDMDHLQGMDQDMDR